jgi:hypothetical protein
LFVIVKPRVKAFVAFFVLRRMLDEAKAEAKRLR